MINDFHFSHEFLSCSALNISVISDAILDSWLNFGCLIAPVDKLKEYKEWIEYQEPKLIKKWSNAFSYNLIESMSGAYKNVSELENLEGCFNYICDNNIPTLIINEDERTNLDVQCGSHLRERTEVINVNNFNESVHFSNSKNLKNSGILAQSDIDTVWRERFYSLANRTKKILIIDRYFFKNLQEDIGCRKTSIEKFIDLLTLTGKKFSIDIYSVGDIKDGDLYNQIINYINLTLSKRPNYASTVSHFQVNSCRDELFRERAHDRFLQFDNFTIQLGLGMAVFRSFPLSSCTFSFHRTETDPIFNDAYSKMWKNCLWRYSC
ncbi:hypothetical protein [Vibrio tritonius]|uniref:hypothetical protein n=1 Tax=Vibrio tritonius TaxID=1435069 RepID=UPI00315DB19F